MRTKGFSLIEILTVTVILMLLVIAASLVVVREIDRARGSTLVSEARLLRTAALAVMIEHVGRDITDAQYTTGLTGLVDDPIMWPVETRISQRMTAYLGYDIVLGAEPGDGVWAVEFVIENGEIISMTCRSAPGGRIYAVTIESGETTVVRE